MSTTTKDGGTAFPVPNDANVNGQEGMSLRDWFAGQAINGLLAHTGPSTLTAGPHYPDAAEHAYAVADAMLKARENKA